MLVTKSSSYKIQDEYRLGIVSSQMIIDNEKLDKELGANVVLKPVINKFAIAKFPRNKMQNLNVQELSLLNED
ncbi:hypothetical protein ACFQGR_03240 [Weissella sagaensis]|uniref:Uncharacterized protein n=1 Tax=Weissella sagaensis TaxID=2559928 RepID=A0ABW1RSM3_9LACO|nr:hypothetical protein [Weissella sagaensis]QDJ58275.1 hypothetical protein EFA59_01525 [Weissella hellenica]QEA57268.1 hypothetical protein FGL75_05030 [Weissella hellenica]UEG66382.1 hypothetical protein GZH44_06300 [Weissella hellenica]